jgi:uncharacterized coiled-coil protein SlyX
MEIYPNSKFNQTIHNVNSKLVEANLEITKEIDKLNLYFEKKSASRILKNSEIENLRYVNDFRRKLQEISNELHLVK